MAKQMLSLESLIGSEKSLFRRNLSGTSAKFLLAIPAMFTIGVAMQRKDPSPAFQLPNSDPELNARIDAYVAPMQRYAEIEKLRPNVTADASREVANAWISGQSSGALKPLPTASYSDSVYDGPSGQVIRAESTISARMQLVMQGAAKAKQYDQAADDAMTILGLAQVMKFSDLSLNTLLNSREVVALDFLRKIAPNVSKARREEIAMKLPGYRLDGPRFADLARTTFASYLAGVANGNTNEDNGEPERCPNLNALRELAPDGHATAALKQVLSHMSGPELEETNFQFEATLYRALLHEKEAQSSLEKTLEAYE